MLSYHTGTEQSLSHVVFPSEGTSYILEPFLVLCCKGGYKVYILKFMPVHKVPGFLGSIFPHAGLHFRGGPARGTASRGGGTTMAPPRRGGGPCKARHPLALGGGAPGGGPAAVASRVPGTSRGGGGRGWWSRDLGIQ